MRKSCQEKCYTASPSLTLTNKIWSPKQKMPPQSNESQLYEVDIRGIIRWEALDPCLFKFPHPWEKCSASLHPFYNLLIALGQADDICTSLNYFEIKGKSVSSATATQHLKIKQFIAPRVVSDPIGYFMEATRTCRCVTAEYAWLAVAATSSILHSQTGDHGTARRTESLKVFPPVSQFCHAMFKRAKPGQVSS